MVSSLTLAFSVQPVRAHDEGVYVDADGGMSQVTGNAVANVTSFEAVRLQQKMFYAAGRYWVFYVDGDYPTSSSFPDAGVYYTTSSDGVSWAPPTMLASGFNENSGENVEAFLSNSGYLQVFYRNGPDVLYRMGTPNPDGTITWVTANWQIVFSVPAGGNCDFFAVVDSNDYPWVSWGYFQEPIQSLNPSDTKMYVWKDAFNNGTWQTAAGFPYNVGTGNYTNDFMVPLSNGQIYVMYFLDNPPVTGQIYGELWNGTAWGPQETCTTSQVNEQYAFGHESYDRTAVADSNDNIYLAFLSSSLNLMFAERTMSGGWSGETVVQSNCGSYASPSLNLYNGVLRLFWINNSTSICYKNYVDGVWDADPTLIVNETNSQIAVGTTAYGTDDGFLNAYTMSLGGSICLLWMNNQTATNTGQIMFGFWPQTGPEYLNIRISGTAVNSLCTFSCCWTDVLEGLGAFVFSTNNTGSWQNDSAVSLSGTFAWTNVTKTLTSTVGAVVGYEWFACDASGNWASTGVQTLTTRALFHDVAVTNVASSATITGLGLPVDLSVTVANLGDFSEIVNVTGYANTTSIGSENLALAAGNSATIMFTWDTTGFAYGNYLLSAYALPVPGETDTANNNCTGGWVTISPSFAWTEPIYIEADGSIWPSAAPISTVDHVTYTLTADIITNITTGSGAIIIQRDNIILDGAGYTLQGTQVSNSTGIMLTGTNNVTIRNVQITSFGCGVMLNSSDYDTLTGNTITENSGPGVELDSSSNNNIAGNNITANSGSVEPFDDFVTSTTGYGVWLNSSNDNSVTGNTITENNAPGVELDSSSNDSIAGNNITANIGYIGFVGELPNLASAAGYGILLDSSSNNSIRGNDVANNNAGGMLFSSSSNNSVSGNNIANNEFELDSSSDNSLCGNSFVNCGLSVSDSYVNVVTGNLVNGNPLVYLEAVSDYAVFGDAGEVILVNCSNITVENLNLSNTTVGVELSGTSNAKILENNIANNGYGILLQSSNDNILNGNSIVSNGNGVCLDFSTNNSVNGNTITENSGFGIELDSSSNNSIAGNNMIANGVQLSYSYNNGISGNNITANSYQGIDMFCSSGNSLNGNNLTDNDAGIYGQQASNNIMSENNIVNDTDGITLDVWSNSNVVSGNNVANCTYGIMIRFLSDGNNVTENNVTGSGCGIFLDMGASSNSVKGNNLTSNGRGIYLYFNSNDNVVTGNNIISNSAEGILLDSSTNTNITGNNVANNGYGIGLVDSSNGNNVYGNNIASNSGYGISLDSSSSNSVSGNNLTENGVGVELDSSSENTFCLNNFLNNIVQVSSSDSTNVWDGGYPFGGNYWSDYAGVDFYNGPYQNQTGSDGIGDTPYIIDSSNRDNYPLMKPYVFGVHDVAVTNVVSSKTVVGQGFSTTVSVTVANRGIFTETFNVTAYASTTSIWSESVTLAAGNSTTVTFAWNTTGFVYGNYTISAYALPVPGETDTANNNCTGGWVIVSLPGDITGPNGVPDGKVDIRDIAYIAKHFGSTPESPNWNANCDLNNDGKVDIRDIHIAAENYGQHSP